MKILLTNKFLYPKGGAETYVIKLGNYFKKNGHEVQYFGMFNTNNTLYNEYNLYVSEKDFQKNSLKNVLGILSLINNKEAYKKMLNLLNLYNPDLIVLNNIEYHLTPSIIKAIGKYKEKNQNIKLFYVAHDYQIICPSHGLFDLDINPCEKCLNGNYWNCFKTKCLKNSRAKSLIATIDSIYWHRSNVYKYVDKIICPSNFMKNKLDTQEELKNKTITIHNFVDIKNENKYNKEDYILYFGAFTIDKGIRTLLKICDRHPEIIFKFAGYGPLENELKNKNNVEFLGFKSGEELQEIISKARISVYPSQWYENCPFSVIESQMYKTPVIGSNMGGIPELIRDGETGFIFESKNDKDLEEKILLLWNNRDLLDKFTKNCENIQIETLDSYYKKIIKLYEGEKI